MESDAFGQYWTNIVSVEEILLKKIKYLFYMKKPLLFMLLIGSLISAQEKVSIGVIPFTSSYDKSITRTIEEAVTNSFAKTKRFDIVSRAQMEALRNERELQKTEDFMDGTFIAKSKNLGAQYLVAGNINSVTATEQNHVDSKGKHYTTYDSTISLDIKLIDIETGKILASDMLATKADKGILSLKSWTNVLTGKDPQNTQEAFAVAVQDISGAIDKFVGANFPVSFPIVEIQEFDSNSGAKKILIAGGSAFGIKEKDKLIVSEVIEVEVAGKMMKRKKPIGELKVIRIEDENFSVCEVKSGGVELSNKFKAKANLQIITS
ncbi:CsgG/HfaB family protein [Kaistella rhinocerotis]|uniref:CsgG/HfaB family protein n=1 Tax=Kaistella rhinocerotis TaxID=3026437 RepID=UPI002555A3C5|nr:CsgG/HfaB family protein [Kaistella sp. Ran72]